jgi:hypothetical protein
MKNLYLMFYKAHAWQRQQAAGMRPAGLLPTRYIVKPRMYQPGFAVCITLALKKYAKFCQIQRQQDTR